MKRIFTMLLIACSVITTASANISAEPQKKPEYVIAQLNYIARTHGQREGQTYSINKNPNTGIIESSQRIVPIAATMVGKGPYFNNITQAFMHDEPLSYQFLHIEPGSSESFALKVITNNGEKNITLQLRTNKNQELWFMCCKNSDNPQLRDAYAIVWEVNYNGRKPMDTGSYPMKGTIYMITSLRPDLYTKDQGGLKNVFKIEGRVDANIKDSLYNIYIADTKAELEAIGDDDYVACVPVINKRFEYQTELDHPVVGRLRCIFPDGSLCKDWIDLDFVPGETYRITVHNGYYDEDIDYERRVGRGSGKSLLVNTLPSMILPPNETKQWENGLSPEVKAEILEKAADMLAKMKMVEASYGFIASVIRQGPANLANLSTYIDKQCPEIIRLNKEMDKAFQDVIRSIVALNPPQKVIDEMYSEGYKDILKVLVNQNNSFNEIFKARGSLSAQAKEAQKYINSLTEKYIEQMTKHVIDTK